METASSRTERLSLLLQAVAELPDAERRDFLSATCKDDPALMSELDTITIATASDSSGLDAPAAAPGDVIGDRFQIVQQLGAGGMGTVYEAIDTKLMERRALKFARRGHDRRIPDEARAALRITHENICRTFEIHSTATCDFISMELLVGPTLSRKFETQAPTQAEALDIARQLCNGLEAAHAAQILHLDLKGNNVILVRRADGTARVVITDFGLARSMRVLERGHAGFGGTPSYIAPERWKGAPATPACDIYALGVILYELLAGRLPYPRGTSWEQRLNTLPLPPSRSNRAPDARWDRIVLHCLEPDPARRFASVRDVRKAIDDTFLPMYRRTWIQVAAAAMIAAAPVVAFRDRIWPPPLVRLAILPFTGSAGDAATDAGWKGALYDVTRELESVGAKSQRLLMIPFEDAIRYGANSPADAAARLGATHVLSGKVSAQSPGFRVQAAVNDVRTGETLRDFGGEFRPGDLGALPGALAGVVTSAFHLSKAPEKKMKAEAYPFYATAVAAMRAAPPRVGEAIASLQKALEKDASSAAVYATLADAYTAQYDTDRTKATLEAAHNAAERAQSLQPDSPAVLLSVGNVEQREGRLDRALELFRRSAQLEPNNVEAWNRTGIAMQRAGRDKEAVEALKRAVQIAPDYWKPHSSLGFVYFRMGRPSDALTEYQKVTEVAPSHPDAFSNLGAVLIALDRYPEAETALRKAIEMRPTRPSFTNLGVLLRYERKDREAVPVFENAVKSGSDDAGARMNLANALRATGQADEARAQFERASALARTSLVTNPADAIARARLSYCMARLGQAEMAGDNALQAAHLAGSDYSVVFWCVMTMEVLGRRKDALSLLASQPQERLKDLRRQPDLAALVADPAFQVLLNRH